MIDANKRKDAQNAVVLVEIDNALSVWTDRTGDAVHTEARAWAIHDGLMRASAGHIKSVGVYVRSAKKA